ncbi:MAG TPA: hypothetical protein VJC16_06575 [Candidatus Nanoarchaeia archaeon]|nr:hypothetical protein [Candidatus Nanoarchaeia archaeon]
MGTFIVLYGINNIGKTTQARRLAAYLRKQGHHVAYFKSPDYGLASGRQINAVLRSHEQRIPEPEFQQLYAKNRLEQQPAVLAALRKGDVVMEDYVGTSFAWGSAKGMPMASLKRMNQGLLREDAALLLDGKRFLSGREKTHIHEINDALLRSVRKKHLELAKAYRWQIINANQPRDKVFQDIIRAVGRHGR